MDRKFVILLGVFFVLFGLFISLILFERPLVRLTRAQLDTASSEKSIIFAWPLKVPANGADSSTITVFVRNKSGDEFGKRAVTLTSTIGQISEPTVVADKLGKAEFKIKSSAPGTAEIKAIIDNTISINQTLSIEFTPL